MNACRLTAVTAAFALMAASPVMAQTNISMYVNQFYAPETNPEVTKVTQELVAEYEAEHPDVKINLIPHIADVNAYQAWLTTRFTAGDEPDKGCAENRREGRNFSLIGQRPQIDCKGRPVHHCKNNDRHADNQHDDP